MKTTAIVLAAGSGKRMGTAVKKQYLDIGGHPVLYYSLNAFEQSGVIDDIILVTSAEDIDDVKEKYMDGTFSKLSAVIIGGKERYDSVYNGLCAAKGSDYIFIHDGARPFVDGSIIEDCMDAVMKFGACVAAVKSKDTVKIADGEDFIADSPDRKYIWNVQTPQCFEYEGIYKAYSLLNEAEKEGRLGNINITDDTMVAGYFGGMKVKLVESSYNNIKITTMEDLPLAETILKSRSALT